MALLAAVGLWLTTVVQGNLVASLIALTVATLGIAVSTPLLVTTTTENLKPEMRAIGIPLLTSLGILGGFVSPAVTGYINTTTGNPIYSMYLVIGLFVAAAALMLVVAPRGIAKPV